MIVLRDITLNEGRIAMIFYQYDEKGNFVQRHVVRGDETEAKEAVEKLSEIIELFKAKIIINL